MTVLSFLIVQYICLLAPLPKEQSGTIRGQVVWVGEKLPARKKIEIRNWPENLDKPLIYEDELVINPNNHGVRWAVVFLAKLNKEGELDHTVPLPIHPSLKKINNPNVYLDMPKCQFEPHIVTFREGQNLTVVNSSPLTSCIRLQVSTPYHDPNVSVLIKSKKDYYVKQRWPARYLPIYMECALQRHMRGFAWKFPHPYFAVTDKDGKFEIPKVMPGKYRLISWQEETGWIVGGKNGIPITMLWGKDKNVGKLKLKLPEMKKGE